MPNYDKLHPPQGLVYVANADKVRSQLNTLLRNAKQGKHQDVKTIFEMLINENPGLSRCADYWVFIVRYYVISRDVASAVVAL